MRIRRMTNRAMMKMMATTRRSNLSERVNRNWGEEEEIRRIRGWRTGYSKAAVNLCRFRCTVMSKRTQIYIKFRYWCRSSSRPFFIWRFTCISAWRWTSVSKSPESKSEQPTDSTANLMTGSSVKTNHNKLSEMLSLFFIVICQLNLGHWADILGILINSNRLYQSNNNQNYFWLRNYVCLGSELETFRHIFDFGIFWHNGRFDDWNEKNKGIYR